jgi:isopropylmalate/homocitrate/citramalate synthase
LVGLIREHANTILDGSHLTTQIREKYMFRLSHLVESITRIPTPPQSSYVGRSVRDHGAGIHVSGAQMGMETKQKDIYNYQTHDYGVPRRPALFNARSGKAQILEMSGPITDDELLNDLICVCLCEA